MTTPAQSIFPPKPKEFSTPLRPIRKDKTVKTPLDPIPQTDEVEDTPVKRPRGRPSKAE